MENFKNLEKELPHNEIVLVVLPKLEYVEKIMKLLKITIKQNKRLCYVSLNKPKKTLEKELEKYKINPKNLFIIDCVSKTAQQVIQTKSTIFISSPKHLTELSIAVKKAIDLGADIFLIDSLSTLLIYEKETAVIKFTHYLISKLRATDRKAIFIIIASETSRALFEDLCMFVDAVVEFDTIK